MTNHRKTGIKTKPGYPLILGANKMAEGYNFAVEAEEGAEVSLLLYRKKAKLPSVELKFEEACRTGRIYSMLVQGLDTENYEYNFCIDKKIVTDPCAYRIQGRNRFGAALDGDEHKLRCGFLPETLYDWEEDKAPDIAYEDMLLYKLHVRGYTKQAKLEPAKRGTFEGLVSMIPYWKELGINAVELMPAYEFMEVSKPSEYEGLIATKQSENVNYWGYAPGYYFAPKSSYCKTKEPEKEFCDLIKALHRAGIACIMEMYFPAETSPLVALRSLQFWKRYYHVDGFHLLGDGAPLDMIMRDGLLDGTKILAAGFDENFYRGKAPKRRSFGEYNLGFLQDMRRFLKSDEEMVQAAQYRIRRNPDTHGVVNYITCQDGFTLNDLVSYNYKHNEANGEGNGDGSSYNYSWNCGVEGPSRKALIRQIRERQMKNAFALMLFSQGVPMIYGGDEIGNSQEGNNNAYCQDNPLGWVDWKGLKKNEKLLSFVKSAIAFRRAHPILHMKEEMKETDYLAKGFPDISFHGERAWFCNAENTSRLLGVMYCGAYAKKADGTEDDYIFAGYNFHWETRKMALPNLPKGMEWKKAMDTGEGFCEEPTESCSKSVEIAPRTIVLLIGKKAEPEQEVEENASLAAL